MPFYFVFIDIVSNHIKWFWLLVSIANSHEVIDVKNVSELYVQRMAPVKGKNQLNCINKSFEYFFFIFRVSWLLWNIKDYSILKCHISE